MELYIQLHDNPMPEETRKIMELWNRILNDKEHHAESGRLFEPEGIHKCLTEIEKTYDYFLCLFDKSEIIGTIAINRMDEDKCELRSVYLLE